MNHMPGGSRNVRVPNIHGVERGRVDRDRMRIVGTWWVMRLGGRDRANVHGV